MSAPKLIKVRRDQLEPHPDLANHPTAAQCLKLLKAAKKKNPEGIANAEAEISRFSQLEEGVGMLDPVHVCPREDKPGHFWILDGRHRIEGSKAETFSAWVHPAEAATDIIFSALFDRRNVTKQQLAWFVILKYEDLALKPNQRTGGRPKQTSPNPERFSLKSVSEHYKIRQEDLSQAAQLYRKAHAAGNLEKISAGVWSGLTLGGLITGAKTAPGSTGTSRNEYSLRATRNACNSFVDGMARILTADDDESDTARLGPRAHLVTKFRGEPGGEEAAAAMRLLLAEAIEAAGKPKEPVTAEAGE